MNTKIQDKVSDFTQALGLYEEPLGLFHTDTKPEDGFSPKPKDLPTAEKERNNEIDWQDMFGNFECALRSVWLARKKQKPAYFSKENFGCPGASFWLGFNKPQTETIIRYVSEGSEYMHGEHYCRTANDLRKVFADIDPPAAPKEFCVIKPLSLFKDDEEPEVVIFFARPEAVGGLNQLSFFITNDPEVVVSPWGSGCGSIVTWPLYYLAKGQTRAVVGGWDPSARKYFKTDELSFSVPYSMFEIMIDQYEESFISTETWAKVKQRIEKSDNAWKK